MGSREAFPTEIVYSAELRPVTAVPKPTSASVSPRELRGARPALPPCIFVVPAYNEEDNILRLLDDFAARPELFATTGGRVIVVDDGSDDATPELVARYSGPVEVELVALDRNQGPGAAFRAGFAAALGRCPDNVCIVTLEAERRATSTPCPRRPGGRRRRRPRARLAER